MKTFPAKNPRTGRVDCELENWPAARIAALAGELRRAQSAWRDKGFAHRRQALLAWRGKLLEHGEAISEALTEDIGRRLISRFEARKPVELIDYWLKQAPAMLAGDAGRSQMAPTVDWRHVNEPYPLVGVISPWNFPLALAALDAVPALLAGCAVIVKPSEAASRFARPLLESIAAVPDLYQVFRCVTGDGDAGRGLIDNADAVCFTGSVATGRKVAVHAARRLIPAFLELGGKDPAIVAASADLENAVRAIARSAFGASGQACQSLERAYVARELYADFLAALVEAANNIRLNDACLDEGHIGPLMLAAQADKIRRQLDDARARGARVHCGGAIETRNGGMWCRPTVVSEVDGDMLIMREETFGPVIAVSPFDSTEEAIALANDSDYGLSAAVFAGSREEAEAIAARLEVGGVSINDASLTATANDVEKNSFRLSGLGGSRMGPSGMRRFLRKRALLYQNAPAQSIDSLREGQSIFR